jgi:pilus assembly protein Flp/PilA
VQQLLAACRNNMRVYDARRGGPMNLVKHINAFVRNEEGQDLIEYALLVALIALVCVVALTTAGSQIKTIFENIQNRLTTAAANT